MQKLEEVEVPSKYSCHLLHRTVALPHRSFVKLQAQPLLLSWILLISYYLNHMSRDDGSSKALHVASTRLFWLLTMILALVKNLFDGDLFRPISSAYKEVKRQIE